MLKKDVVILALTGLVLVSFISCTNKQHPVSAKSKVNISEKYEPIKQNINNKIYTYKSNIEIQSKTNKPHYNPYNLTEVSNISRKKLWTMLDGLPIQKLTNTFIYCEEKYGVNALFLVGLVSLESGYGTSNRANNGSNNLTGHAVYKNISRGSYFDSWEHCVEETASLISNGYLYKDGQYHNGVSIWSVNKSYSASNKWASDINWIIKNLSK